MSELDYDLPPERIAVHPAEPRDHSRLMVVHRADGHVEHRRFHDLPEYLQANDLLVVNDTRVIPAKLELRKETGAAIPGLFVRELEPGLWEVMLRTRGRAKAGDYLIAGRFRFLLEERLADKGMWRMRVEPALTASVVLPEIGHVPLPPYIEKMRHANTPDTEQFDRQHYQTVYAREGKSVAAPTAGLHFTPDLLNRIDTMGVRRVGVDLEVGLGTFLPVETDTLEDHRMHIEEYAIPAATIDAIRRQRACGGRIVVVGTTAVRTLESAASQILASSPPTDIRGSTDLKISPGFSFQLTDVLITNFHLPRSTLMALVGALVGVERLKQLYALAVQEGYRFYSYGDAMLILP
ncbi:MAG TPA: tRNA preQ1(34) S-adenosylmethionine ribosyltransferase-isomerase QueA [Phycisphaerae bacterium]|nr:tRNA preQ1(34) S-adenosylmethionine ribosyltransferase-isomerase QueA [Phycisphaerae bacterium]